MAATLSLIGIIIAVVQTGNRVINLLDKVRPFFNIPKNINLLIGIVSLLKDILVDLSTMLDYPFDSQHSNDLF